MTRIVTESTEDAITLRITREHVDEIGRLRKLTHRHGEQPEVITPLIQSLLDEGFIGRDSTVQRRLYPTRLGLAVGMLFEALSGEA
jgi:hypothetical protein